MNFRIGKLVACFGFALTGLLQLHAEDRKLDSFQSQQLTSEYYSEGAAAGDFDNDGVLDFVYGPHWYAGPDFKTKYEIYPPKPQNREGYSDHFFAWVYDFDNDGWKDIFTVGFPGTPAHVYRNPGKPAAAKAWTKHQVFDSVSNESPQLTQLVGDDRPELVCTRDGYFGFATIDWSKPFDAWGFTAISGQVTDKKFGHGLGVGDVNGDGRMDVIHKGGWFEQPKELSASKPWVSQKASFSNAYGGAEMFAYDVDGDGDNDIITSLAAHDFGLAWFEQKRDGADVEFVRHDILGSKPEHNAHGVVFSELHSVNLEDMDGDGLKDIVTGKTYYSHHKGSPMWDTGAVVYWFKLVRGPNGVNWLPYRVADDSGIGRQIGIIDLNKDGLLDITVGGMKGAHALIHQRKTVDESTWVAAQPIPFKSPTLQDTANKNAMIFEGEKLPILAISDGTAIPQDMSGFAADRWSKDSQLWWTGGKVGSRLELELKVETAGKFDVMLALTKAQDYGVVQVWFDKQKLGEPIDLFNKPSVISTGLVRLGQLQIDAGKHRLSLEIVGANKGAVPTHMVGLDVVQLGLSGGVQPQSKAGKKLNLNFEKGTLEDWTATGNAFDGQPIQGDTVATRRGDMKSQHEGEFWIGGFETLGDKGKGTLTSTGFVVDKPFASYLIGGGSSKETRVELVEVQTNKVLHQAMGRTTEDMRLVVIDLTKHQGKECVVRLIDESSAGWGHLNFDGFQLHESQPGPITVPETPMVADQYPFEGLKAVEAAKAMKVPEGFRVIASASEPDVLQPIAMALDDRGRVWIAEAYEYPIRAADGKARDRILIFEDTNGDGTLDSRKVFAEGLNLVSGMEVGFGGVWVGAAPYLLFIPDRNGDDKADGKPEILLDGWGYQDTHETLNAFIWGPDGWLYGCHGVFTHSKVGKPGTPDKDRVPLNAGVWRYHPTRHEFEVFAHGTSNPWGVDFNDRGQAFITACVIPHLYHMIQGGRYERQGGTHFNPYTYDDIKTIAEHRHYVGATPHAGNGKSDSVGGGHAHAGAMIYLGNTWPEKYRDQIFMNNIHGQRLNIDALKQSKSGYIGSYSPDFLLTHDKASQILNLRYGPDGQAWMIDWYDMQACHLTDPGKHDRSNGRIYKIVYGDLKPVQVDLSKQTDKQLVENMLNPNDWYVRHSRRALQERAATGKVSSDAIELLKSMVVQDADETRKLRAAWCLSAMDQFDAKTCQAMLSDKSEYVRAWAIQLGRQSTSAIEAVSSNQLAKMAGKEKSSVVRLYLASAAQRLPMPQRWELLQNLIAYDDIASDHNLPLMLWYAAEPLAELDAERAMALGLAASKTVPILRDYMLRRIGASASEQAIASLVNGLSKADTEELQLSFLNALASSLTGKRKVQAPKQWDSVYQKLIQSSAKVRLKAESLGVTFGSESALVKVRNLLQSTSENTETRLAALNSLLGAKDPKLVPVLKGLLTDKSLRGSAIAGLSQYSDPTSANSILDVYPDLTQTEKRIALGALSARPDDAITMLQAIDSKRIASSDLSADLVRQLENLKSEKVSALLTKTWGIVRETPADKAKLIDEYKTLVQSKKQPKPDLALGRAVYAKTCQQCHVLFAAGGKIGPELTGSNRANLDYLLSNVVDPSAVMAKEYQPTIVLTDGRTITGLIKAEDSKAITLQTANAIEVIPLAEIEERKLSDKSMMPDDQLRQYSPHEIRSLMAYLASEQQGPILATQSNAQDFFNGQNLAYWRGDAELWKVADGEIVGLTKGLKHNDFLMSEFAVEDFHLKVEIKLVGNLGNSGIQFRSAATESGMKGYQADVGEGWWGKLYEEEGRALLWDKSGEKHVKNGEWNVYEVRAVGSKIQTWINGQLCVDLDDPKGAVRGIIAFQLHSGGATEVRLRNIELRVLEAGDK